MALAIGSVTKGLGQMVKSPEVIAVVASVFVTPLVQPFIQKFLNKIPFLRDHGAVALGIFALFFFTVASRVKAGILRAIMIGVAGSLMILAIAPAINKLVRR